MMLSTSGFSAAQESDVDVIAPTRITQDLITRSDLNRLMNQQPQDRNPLRQAQQQRLQQTQEQTLPPTVPQTTPQTKRKLPQLNQGTFQDPNVQPASWQEEHPETTSVQENQPQETQQSFGLIGPMPSFEMESHWGILDRLSETSIEDLQEVIAKRRSIVNSSITIDDESKKAIYEQIEIAETAIQQATSNIQNKADYQERMISLPADIERLRLAAKQTVEPTSADRTLPIESMLSLIHI